MSDTTTSYLGLTKPAIGGSNDTWGNKQNADADVLDANAVSNANRLAALESRCAALEARPSVQEAIGTVKWWPTNRGWPPGYLICDGSLYSPATYPDLFNLLSNGWGGDGVNNFAVPDLRGCVCIGMDEGTGRLQGQYGPDRIGGIGGTAVVGLTVAQMPAHTHGGVTDVQGQHIHDYNSPVVQQPGWFIAGSGGTQLAENVTRTTDGTGAHGHTLFDYSAGGNAPHTNCQVGALGYFVIKAVNQ